MGLKNAGIPARDYGNNRRRIACRLYEGNLTYDPNGFTDEGRVQGTYNMTAPMHKGQYVEFHEDSTAENIIVQPAAKDSTEIVGKFIIVPKLRWKPDEYNRLPRENAEWGEFSPRLGTIEFFADAVDYIDLVEDNAKIVPFNSIVYVDEDKFDKKASGTSNTKAMANKAALASGKLPVLSGFYGMGI